MIDATLLPALLSLLAIARSGSVGAAPRQHHRTSAAISQQIRKLERQLDVKLLERAGRGVRLTAAGEAALPGILQLGTETEALFAQLAQLSGPPPETLRVAVSDYLGRALLVPVLHELLEEQPRLRFEIATTHSRESVRLVGRGAGARWTARWRRARTRHAGSRRRGSSTRRSSGWGRGGHGAAPRSSTVWP